MSTFEKPPQANPRGEQALLWNMLKKVLRFKCTQAVFTEVGMFAIAAGIRDKAPPRDADKIVEVTSWIKKGYDINKGHRVNITYYFDGQHTSVFMQDGAVEFAKGLTSEEKVKDCRWLRSLLSRTVFSNHASQTSASRLAGIHGSRQSTIEDKIVTNLDSNKIYKEYPGLTHLSGLCYEAQEAQGKQWRLSAQQVGENPNDPDVSGS